MTFLVATNVVASRPPERRPTGTLTARANFVGRKIFGDQIYFLDQKFFWFKFFLETKYFLEQ